jgi:hypothetical protein
VPQPACLPWSPAPPAGQLGFGSQMPASLVARTGLQWLRLRQNGLEDMVPGPYLHGGAGGSGGGGGVGAVGDGRALTPPRRLTLDSLPFSLSAFCPLSPSPSAPQTSCTSTSAPTTARSPRRCRRRWCGGVGGRGKQQRTCVTGSASRSRRLASSCPRPPAPRRPALTWSTWICRRTARYWSARWMRHWWVRDGWERYSSARWVQEWLVGSGGEMDGCS